MKSILIVNNTKGRCKCCPLLEVLDYNEEECKCYMTGFDVTDVVAEDKYAYTCPLKPMPQINEERLKYLHQFGSSDRDLQMYVVGHDDCLDEILGGKDE